MLADKFWNILTYTQYPGGFSKHDPPDPNDISEEAFWRVEREESDDQEHEKKNNTQNDNDLDWLNNLMLAVADAFGNGGGGGRFGGINNTINEINNSNNMGRGLT